MVLVVFNLNTRDRSPGSGSHFLHTATQFLRSVTQSLRGLLIAFDEPERIAVNQPEHEPQRKPFHEPELEAELGQDEQ